MALDPFGTVYNVCDIPELQSLTAIAEIAANSSETLRWQRARIAAAATPNSVQKQIIMRQHPDMSYEDIEAVIVDTQQKIMDIFNWQEGAFYKAARMGKHYLPNDCLKGYSYNEHQHLAFFEMPPSRDVVETVEEYERRRQLDKLHRQQIVVRVNGMEFESKGQREDVIRKLAQDYRSLLRAGMDTQEAINNVLHGYRRQQRRFTITNPNELEDVIDFIANHLYNGPIFLDIGIEKAPHIAVGENTQGKKLKLIVED